LPQLSPTSLPEVAGRGVRGFGRVDLPVAREAGLPEVRGLEMDLPGVGESLPAVAEFGEAHLPTVGDALPATKTAKGRGGRGGISEGFDDEADPFGVDADGDPFGALEAGLGGGRDGGGVGEPWSPEAFAAHGASAEAAAYGEVEIGGGPSGHPPIETVDDMEFSAIPDAPGPTPGRAAASATVHDGADVESNGSTLELGHDRRTFVKSRSKRLAIASAICASVVAGGALALVPAVGPFGVHFVLDQVKRAEREQALVKLVEDERRAQASDTFGSVREVLGKFDAARQTAPRFEPLHARAALANFDAVLRFGPLPKLEAAGKAALAAIDAESTASTHRLARAAQSAALRGADAKPQLEALGSDPDARQLLAALALATADHATAAAICSELVKQFPDSARAAHCFGSAQLGLGKIDAAIAAAERALGINAEHVGAQILMFEARRAAARASAKKRTETLDSEALSAAVQRVLPRASPGEAALAHSVLGELHSSQGRSGPAQHAFEEALAIDRTFPRALIGLGETLHRAGRNSEALARFEAAARAEPGSLAAELGIAKSQILLAKLPEAKALLTRLQAEHKEQPEIIYWIAKAEQAIGANEAAMAGYRAAIEAGKGRADSVDAYLALAKLQADLGQLVEAQKTLSEADDKLPPSVELHKALGEIAMNRAQYVDAYSHFAKAEELDPGDTRARFLGAVALTRLGRFDEALAAFQRVSETDNDFPGLAVERGRLYEESGKSQEALKEYEIAFTKAPDDMDLQIRLGCARVVAGRAADAEALLEKVAKAMPRSAEAHHCLGRAMFEQERFGDAITRLERAAGLDASRAVYSLFLGWALAEVGRHGDAEVALDRALELDKGLADAHWQRGRLRLKQGAVKDAIRDLEHALELKPSRHEARGDLAMAYADFGRLPQALQAWEEALARDPDNATWHFRYGKLLSSSGNGAQAAAHLRRAIDLALEANAAPTTARPKPPIWLWQGHYLLARELGMIPAAIAHWQAYLRLSPADDPYRPEAERALAALGQPWEPR
jgi:tetratricopeptide (TPR) repeat protein